MSSRALADAISPHLARTRADTLVAEVLPLLDACRFLEQQAPTASCAPPPRPQRPARSGSPGVTQPRSSASPSATSSSSVPPTTRSSSPACRSCRRSPPATPSSGSPAPAAPPSPDIFAAHPLPMPASPQASSPSPTTPSTPPSTATRSRSRQGHLHRLRRSRQSHPRTRSPNPLTPVVVELSGCDAVIVLPSADPRPRPDALPFGMRLNGSATCMAPRRLFLVGDPPRSALLAASNARFSRIPVPQSPHASASTAAHCRCSTQAQRDGATVHGDLHARAIHRPSSS